MITPSKLPATIELHTLFEEKEPGVLYYRKTVNSQAKVGQVAGTIQNIKRRNPDSGNYWKIAIKGHLYLRHRLIWKMHHGTDPLGVIDHINEIKGDDRIENLRDITESENMRTSGEFICSSFCNKNGGLYNQLKFSFLVWPDEDIDTLQQELEKVVGPILQDIIAKRLGRKRPK